MNHTVAVITGSNGYTSAFLEGTLFKIFADYGGKWTQTGSLAFCINTQSGFEKIRQELTETERSLSLLLNHDSKILVGSSVTGLPYNIFDAADYTIFEIEGKPEQFIDRLGTQIEAQKTEAENGETVFYTAHPVEGGGGRYFINLKILQIKKPGVTSKQALMPFFTNQAFMSLEIICTHIPPWFDRDFERLGLVYTANQTDGALHVTVTHKLCGDCIEDKA